MTATEWLQERKTNLELMEWLVGILPQDLPEELRVQLRVIGASPDTLKEAYAKIVGIDWALNEFNVIVPKLPSAAQQDLKLSDRLAVGSVLDAEFSGTVIRLPNDRGLALVLCSGAFGMIGNAAELICLAAAINLQEMIVNAGSSTFKIPNVWIMRWARWFRLNLARMRMSPSPLKYVAWNVPHLVKRYCELGVSDTPDAVRLYGPIPLPMNPRRYGHPLEAGSYLSAYGRRFLILHECAHVVLRHLCEDDLDAAAILEREFKADRWAFENLLFIHDSDIEKAASLLGAWVVLTALMWIEDFEPSESGSHPSARQRLERLDEFVDASDSMTDSIRQLVRGSLKEFLSLSKLMWASSEEMRKLLSGTPNALMNCIELCSRNRSPKVFRDQFPRWLLQGAPVKLCKAFADASTAVKKELLKMDPTPELELKRQMIQWALDAAARSNSKRLADFVEGIGFYSSR